MTLEKVASFTFSSKNEQFSRNEKNSIYVLVKKKMPKKTDIWADGYTNFGPRLFLYCEKYDTIMRRKFLLF